MEPTNRITTKHIVIAALSGGVVSALAAFLLTPKSGRDTRRQLAGYFNDAKNTVSRVPEAFKSASHAAGEALMEPRA